VIDLALSDGSKADFCLKWAKTLPRG